MAHTTLDSLARWAAEITLQDIPDVVREQAKNQVLSTLAAVHSGYTSDLGGLLEKAFPPGASGNACVLPSGAHTHPSHAAFLMSAWSMTLDFDDVMLGGHTGHSSVLVPMAYIESVSGLGADLLVSQVAANELAARINMAVSIGSIRGQMATHVHLVASAAARAKLEGLGETDFSHALAFSLSYPAKALYPAFLGSDAKALCASWPIRMGLDAVDAVRAGLRGNTAILDDTRGFIKVLAQAPILEFFNGLGHNWHTATNSFKIYPGCGYIDAVIDAILALVRSYDVAPDEIQAVDVYVSFFTIGMEYHSKPYLNGASSRIATLTFSTAYNAACAILHRKLVPEHFKRKSIEDPRVWSLAQKVRLHHDPQLTIAALTADIPIGAALKQAGRWTAFRYALALGRIALGDQQTIRSLLAKLRIAFAVARVASAPRPLDFSHCEKRLGARVELRTVDGRSLQEEVLIPNGFAGNGDWKRVRLLMREKFINCAAPNVGTAAAEEAANMLENLEKLNAREISRLISLNCRGVRKIGIRARHMRYRR